MTHPAATRNISCDIAIVGGGPAGVCAAVAAKAAGAKRVILIEQSARLGGAVTHAMHRSICGLYADKPADLTQTLNSGLQRQIVTSMASLAPEHVKPKQMGKAWVLEFPTDAWEKTLLRLCTQHGVEVHFKTSLTAVQREQARITTLELVNEHAGFRVTPAVVIDATGSGHLLQLAGDDAHHPPLATPQRMMGGYALRLSGLTGDTELLRLQVPYVLAQATAKQMLPAIAKLTVFHPGPRVGQGVCKMAVGPEDLLCGEAISQRAQMIFSTLQAELPAMTQASIMEQSPVPQSRDGVKLLGNFTLKAEHVLGGYASGDPDAVRAWWPIEKWSDAQGPTYLYPPAGQDYEIPPAALVSQNVTNLLAAGMNISAHADAAASLRASGICLAVGELAGRVARTMLE